MRPRIASVVSVMVACLQLSAAFARVRVQEPGQKGPETHATRPASQAPQESPYEDEVVRVTTNLVQVDAVVTDERGRQVTDLRPEDFEIVEDGKARAITNFAYVRVGGGATERGAPAAPASKTKAAPVAPPVTSLRPEQVRRTVALVLDDVLMSFEDVLYARRALAKFVDEQMQPGDLVAILRTSAVAPLDVSAEAQADADAPGGRRSRADARRDARKELEESRQTDWVSVSLAALNQIMQGLQELPGRKAVVLVSDGLPLKIGDELSTPLLENMRRVIERASRASVVIYTIDARGIHDFMLSAADNLGDPLGNKPRPESQVLAVLVDGAGEAVDQVRGTHTFSVRRDSFERLLRGGMDYVLNVPVKRPGGYQLRVAVRDTASGKIGTASRFVEAPDFEGGGLALSGLIISGSAATDVAAQQSSEAAEVESGPAVRRLRQGMMLDYGLVVYNAQAERATGRPKLTTQVSLFRGGRRVYAGSPTSLDTGGQSDPRHIVAGGRLQLGAGMEPGDYVLQVSVTDAARQKPVALSQWIDFEVVR